MLRYTNTTNIISLHVAYQAIRIEEPTTIDNALNSEYSKEWKAVADLEYGALMENQTWNLVEPPKECNVIGCKWVFRVKYDGNGNVKYYKGRLVAQGFLQKHGVDYREVFSPVAHLSSICILLAFAAENKLQIHQMDVVSAFLNGELKEEIYMRQPPGYELKGKEDHLKSLGFKAALKPGHYC